MTNESLVFKFLKLITETISYKRYNLITPYEYNARMDHMRLLINKQIIISL